MPTRIRAEVSKKNKYWIGKNRHYELKHFCLQYPSWKRALASLDGFAKSNLEEVPAHNQIQFSDPTSQYVEEREYYSRRIEMVDNAAKETDPVLGRYILVAITQDLTYEALKTKCNIPCCRAVFYELYRRFFWLLDKARG